MVFVRGMPQRSILNPLVFTNGYFLFREKAYFFKFDKIYLHSVSLRN